MTPAFLAGVGPLELAIVLLIVLIIAGGRRLPLLGRQLGSGMREFKDSVTSKIDADDDDEAEPRALTPPPGSPAQRPTTADTRPSDGA